MTEESVELETYLTKCRCCLQEPKNEEFSIEIDESTSFSFFELTKLELTLSNEFSSVICHGCSSQFKEIELFKNKLIQAQSLLVRLANEFNVEPEIKSEEEDLATETEDDIQSRKDEKQRKAKGKKVQSRHEFPDNKCPICLKHFTERRKIYLHIRRIHEKIRDFRCDLCDYEAHTNFEIVLHKKNIHDPDREVTRKSEMRICPFCGRSVRGNNALTMHIRKKHMKIKKYQCDLCSYESYGKYEMKSHLIHVHARFKESYPCSLCNSTLASSMGLKVHMQHKHSGLKPFSCFCGKSYSLNETLKMHVRNVHYGERKFACNMCPKRFGQAVRLKDHINNVHGNKQEIPCTRCEKVFPSTRNLKAHMVYHEEPQFKCENCGKNFYLSNKLKEHMKTHEGSEHRCNMCDKSFQLLSSLKRHVKKTHVT